jgi:hypothetical protein
MVVVCGRRGLVLRAVLSFEGQRCDVV